MKWEREPKLSDPKLQALIWLSWSAVGLMLALRSQLETLYGGTSVAFVDALAVQMLDAYLWAIFNTGVIAVVRKFPPNRPRNLAIHVPTGIVVSALQMSVFFELAQAFELISPADVSLAKMASNLMIYTIVAGIAFLVPYYLRTRAEQVRASRAEAELSKARLRVLTDRINPHFIFNALNSIAEMVHRDPQGADDMIAALGSLLRNSLDAGDREFIPLAEELEFVRRYLDIERVRFGERLAVRITNDVKADFEIPRLLLQPLVENAVKHGVAADSAPQTVSIAVTTDVTHVILQIVNDAKGDAEVAPGMGLETTQRRLQLMYGDAASLTMARDDGRVVCTVTLPQ